MQNFLSRDYRMPQTPIIAASILSADFARLGEEAHAVVAAGADWIHFDVMDNHYVPNLTVGPMVCSALRKYGIQAPIDVHLMVKPVDNLIPEFARAGATYMTVHPEATEHLDRTLQLIKDHGCKAGIALNPASPLSALDYLLEKIDMVLVMSVNPGFANQAFIPYTLKKIQAIRQLIDQSKLNIRLEVDGGIKLETINAITQAGADTFVIGSAIFNTENYQQTLTHFKRSLSIQ